MGRRDLGMRIAVGSTNPVKLDAAFQGVKAALDPLDPDATPTALGFAVSSGVPDQPWGDDQTRQGAVNRAKAAFQKFEAEHGACPDYAVGLEGGIADGQGEMQAFAWMAVWDGSRWGSARTATFPLPPQIRELVLGGMELGQADDQVFGSINSKQKGGTVGHLTRGVLDRTQYYVPAVTLAMVPLMWPDLWQ